MWPVVALTALLSTTPPLVPAPPPELPPPAPPPYLTYPQPPNPLTVPRKRVEPTPNPPASFALYFAPLNLFALTLWVEGDLHLAEGVSVFANVGGGPLGQFGGDLGFRYYVLGKPFEGFYLDVRASAFSLPAAPMAMVGPGAQLGHGWRFGRFALSIGLGFTTWYGVVRGPPTTSLLGTFITDADIILFPGFTQPSSDRPGVSPTLRISLGPTF